MTINRFDWKRILRGANLRPFDERPYLRTTVITVQNGMFHTTTMCDSAAIHQYGHVLEGEDGETISLDLKQVPNTKGDVMLKLHGDLVLLTAANGMWALPIPEQNIVDVRRIYAKRPEDCVRISFDPKLMMKVLKGLEGEKSVTLRIGSAVSPMLLEGSEGRGLVLPVRHVVNDIEEDVWKGRDRGEPATL